MLQWESESTVGLRVSEPEQDAEGIFGKRRLVIRCWNPGGVVRLQHGVKFCCGDRSQTEREMSTWRGDQSGFQRPAVLRKHPAVQMKEWEEGAHMQEPRGRKSQSMSPGRRVPRCVWRGGDSVRHQSQSM